MDPLHVFFKQEREPKKLNLSERMQQYLQERYAVRPHPAIETDPDEFPSLTPSAIQIDWRAPTKFPHYPTEVGSQAPLEHGRTLSLMSYSQKTNTAIHTLSKCMPVKVNWSF